jgi:hypothetical protein
MKEKRLQRVERRRPLVEINLYRDTKGRPSWPPRPKLSPAKPSGGLRRLLGLRKG